MSRLADYATRYENIRLERQSGVLEMVMHTNGGPMLWSDRIHHDLPDAFHQIAADPENRVVIFSGTGDAFYAGRVPGTATFDPATPPVALDRVYRESKALIENLMSIPVPMIGAINGPVYGHSELLLFCDIVLAADHAEIRDRHLGYGIVPGDGIHVAFPVAFGINRGRYLALTGAVVTAQQALDWGGVAEVMPLEKLMPRAREIAHELAKRPILGLRYTRELMINEIQRQLRDNLALGLIYEGFSSGYGSWGSTLNSDGFKEIPPPPAGDKR